MLSMLVDKIFNTVHLLTRLTGDVHGAHRIPFYKSISRIPTHLTIEEREFLFDKAQSPASGSIIAEIGSYLGASACFLAAGGGSRLSKLYCIDTWENDAMSEGPWDTFDRFQKNTAMFNHVLVPFRGNSVEMAKRLNGPVDLLFVDADHSYDAVARDLQAYLPKLKTGGLLILHDYGWADGVQRAVNEIVCHIRIDEAFILPNMYSVRVDPGRLVAPTWSEDTD
jgi:predicted O-methyltransferase YrrM